MSRHVISLSKFAAAWGVTMVLGALPLGLVGLVLDPGQGRRALALAAGGAVAGTAYAALFLAMAALTRQAVVIGLLFALALGGRPQLRLRRHPLAVDRRLGARGHGRISPRLPDGDVGTTYALVAATVLTVASVWFAGDRLRSFTLRGDE